MRVFVRNFFFFHFFDEHLNTFLVVRSGDKRNFVDHINGTEKSIRDPVRGIKPDEENIGGESEFDRVNAYYQFAINQDFKTFIEMLYILTEMISQGRFLYPMLVTPNLPAN